VALAAPFCIRGLQVRSRGATDPVVPAPQRERLAALLKQLDADVTYHVLPAGHGLTERDLDLLRQWLAARS